MKNINRSIKGAVVCTIAVVALTQFQGSALAYTLTNGTSSADYDPAALGGMTSWVVGGADHLASQTFFVRTGADSRELGLYEIYQTSSQPAANQVVANFGVGGQYGITITYELQNISAVKAQIQESITLKNLSGSSLDLSFFQYNNFDLGANGGGDYGRILSNGTGLYSIAQSVEPGVSSILEDGEVQVNPGSVMAQVAYFDTILSILTNGDIDNLNNSVGPEGPGNIEFAFQWNYTLDPLQETTISKLKTLDVTLIPEPTSAALALLGLGVLSRGMRKNR
jgi:hypothetical protein